MRDLVLEGQLARSTLALIRVKGTNNRVGSRLPLGWASNGLGYPNDFLALKNPSNYPVFLTCSPLPLAISAGQLVHSGPTLAASLIWGDWPLRSPTYEGRRLGGANGLSAVAGKWRVGGASRRPGRRMAATWPVHVLFQRLRLALWHVHAG